MAVPWGWGMCRYKPTHLMLCCQGLQWDMGQKGAGQCPGMLLGLFPSR